VQAEDGGAADAAADAHEDAARCCCCRSRCPGRASGKPAGSAAPYEGPQRQATRPQRPQAHAHAQGLGRPQRWQQGEAEGAAAGAEGGAAPEAAVMLCFLLMGTRVLAPSVEGERVHVSTRVMEDREGTSSRGEGGACMRDGAGAAAGICSSLSGSLSPARRLVSPARAHREGAQGRGAGRLDGGARARGRLCVLLERVCAEEGGERRGVRSMGADRRARGGRDSERDVIKRTCRIKAARARGPSDDDDDDAAVISRACACAKDTRRRGRLCCRRARVDLAVCALQFDARQRRTSVSFCAVRLV